MRVKDTSVCEVEARLSPTPLKTVGGGYTTLLYAAAEPIVSGRSPACTVFGLAGRIPAFTAKPTGGWGWAGKSPLEVDVSALPRIDNGQVCDLLRSLQRAPAPREKPAGCTLRVDREFLVDQLSSRTRLAGLVLDRLGRGKHSTRSTLRTVGWGVPEESCGLFLEVAHEPRPPSPAEGNTAGGSGPAPSYARLARQAAANGYSVLPVRPMTKDPAVKPDWRKRCWTGASAWDLANWEKAYGEAGFGLGCGIYVAAVDIDANDPVRVERIAAIARDILGATPLVRAGRAARLAMIYRCKEAIVTMRWRDLEVLGLGTQIVAYGIHPRTRKPYRWSTQGEPATIPLTDLPAIDTAAVERFITTVAAQSGAAPKPFFGPDERNVIPIVTSLVSMSRLLLGGMFRDRDGRRAEVRRIIDGKYAGTGSGLAVDWRDV